MNNSGVIQTSKSADLVTHKLLIEGNELSGIYQVMSIVVHNEVNRIPMAQIIYKVFRALARLKMVEPMAMSRFVACLVHGLKF